MSVDERRRVSPFGPVAQLPVFGNAGPTQLIESGLAAGGYC